MLILDAQRDKWVWKLIVAIHINVWIDWSNKFYITVPFYKDFSLFCEQRNTNSIKQGKQNTKVIKIQSKSKMQYLTSRSKVQVFHQV